MHVADSGAILRKRGSEKMELKVSGLLKETELLELPSDFGTAK
jgi:hypothetical protein